jgi:hypothetical protein
LCILRRKKRKREREEEEEEEEEEGREALLPLKIDSSHFGPCDLQDP